VSDSPGHLRGTF